MAELIGELPGELVDGGGRRYRVRVLGEPATGRLWRGWLEFASLDGRELLRTEVETTQPDRGALASWAGGLDDVYCQGALDRARRQRIGGPLQADSR